MTRVTRTPVHLWIIAILSLLWNAGGGYDWILAHFSAEQYMGLMTEDQRAWYERFPLWAEVFWALGVWGAILGSIFLLLRSRLAGFAFMLSLIGLLGNAVHSITSMGSALVDMMGPGYIAFSAGIIVVAMLLWVYARAMTRRGVLR